MEKKIKIQEWFRNYIESMFYEYHAIIDIVVNALSLNIDMESDTMKLYDKELKEAFCRYSTVQNFLTDSVKKYYSNVSNWSLDFPDAELSIKE